MWHKHSFKLSACGASTVWFMFCLVSPMAHATDPGKKGSGPPPAPVKVASVIKQAVSEQITLVGSTEPVARSIVAAEVEGLVEQFSAKEADYIEKGAVLAKLRATVLVLRLKSAVAAKKRVQSNLLFAEKELGRYTKLKDADSIAASKYDEALNQQQSLKQELLQTQAEIELLEHGIQSKTVVAPFSGFVAKEHTQVGEWLSEGGSVVTLVDLRHIRVTVDVPERYAVQLAPQGPVRVLIASISNEPLTGKMSGILPEGDPQARTFAVRVSLANPGLKIRSGMEARATFNLGHKKDALLVPKDAIVTAGANRIVFVVANSVAQPVNVRVIGYYDGNVAIEGPVKPGDRVVIRGNERLRPGQPVQILK